MSCSWSAEPIGMPEITKAEVSAEGLCRFALLPVPLKPITWFCPPFDTFPHHLVCMHNPNQTITIVVNWFRKYDSCHNLYYSRCVEISWGQQIQCTFILVLLEGNISRLKVSFCVYKNDDDADGIVPKPDAFSKFKSATQSVCQTACCM